MGQQAFFYHSNTKPPGIVGIVDIVKEAYVDHTQFDPKDPHFDAASKKVCIVSVHVSNNCIVYISYLNMYIFAHLNTKLRLAPILVNHDLFSVSTGV